MGWDGNGNVIRTNGVNTGSTVWQDDRDADTKIRADLHDTHDEDIANSIERCLNLDGENAMAANLDMGGFKMSNAAPGTLIDDFATLGQAQTQVESVAQATGTDALQAVFSPAVASLEDKLTLYVRANAANTSTTPTFSPNGLDAKTIVKNGNEPLIAGDIYGQYHVLILQYRTADDAWELLNPATFETRFPNVSETVTASANDLNRTTDGNPTGAVKMWPFSTAPTAYLFVNGQTIGDTGSGADHEGSGLEALFNLVKAEGSVYGNTGTEVFANGDTVKLPDLRDRSPLGTGTMGTTDAAIVDNYLTRLGDTGGEDTHQLTEAELASHDHGGGSHDHVVRAQSSAGSGSSSIVGDNVGISDAFNPNRSAGPIEASGDIIGNGGISDTPHNTMHPFLAVNFIIKT